MVGVCMARGMRGWGCVHGGGRVCVWGGAYVAGGVHGRGVNERAVRIILEYILVITILLQKVNFKPHSH